MKVSGRKNEVGFGNQVEDDLHLGEQSAPVVDDAKRRRRQHVSDDRARRVHDRRIRPGERLPDRAQPLFYAQIEAAETVIDDDLRDHKVR